MPVHYYGGFQGTADKAGEMAAGYPDREIWVTEWGFEGQEPRATQDAFKRSVAMFESWGG